LERNDLGRVCEFGSVHVTELVRVETYATVHHLVSTVEGSLRRDVSHIDCVRACFPGGSITGAPKIRAMEIIDELEPHARGVYTGAIGFLGYNTLTHLNVAIRTVVYQQGRLAFHAGGGIVTDSEPDAEYDETYAKAKGILNAIEQLCVRSRRVCAPSGSLYHSIRLGFFARRRCVRDHASVCRPDFSVRATHAAASLRPGATANPSAIFSCGCTGDLYEAV
jgi:hypothetical protein